MAAVSVPALVADERIVLPNVSWETYERLLTDDEGRRSPRLTYDQGVLEIVSPSPPHEEDAQTLILLVELAAAAVGVPVKNLGSTTYRRRDLQRGFEADGSFYIQHEPQMRSRREIDLMTDPPPDLVIEVEVSRSLLDKLPMLAAFGVPEVWRGDGERVAILALSGGTYREAATSLALPCLTSAVLTRFLRESWTRPSPEWVGLVTDWARRQRAGE